MDDIQATLRAATRAVREAETLVQARIAGAAVPGHRRPDAQIASELADLRAAAGDLHRAVALLRAGPTGHTA